MAVDVPTRGRGLRVIPNNPIVAYMPSRLRESVAGSWELVSYYDRAGWAPVAPIGEDADELLRLAAHHREDHTALRAAMNLRWHRWESALHALLARRDETAREYVASMPEEMRDEVFDHLATVTDPLDDATPEWVRDWWDTLPFAYIQAAVGATKTRERIQQILVDLAELVTPATATSYVLSRAYRVRPAHPLMAALTVRITDPAALATLYDAQTAVVSGWRDWDAHPQPWRDTVLRRRELPVALCNRTIVESGEVPGPPRHHTAQHEKPHVLNNARLAAVRAEASHVAALVLADPERWWAEAVRKDVARHKPRGTSARANARRVHTALAMAVREAIAADTQEVWLDGTRLVTRHDLTSRLLWLAERGEGPGYEAVLEALMTSSEPRLRRRAAAHPQVPVSMAADLMDDRDRWVRAGGARAFERALATA